MIDIKKYYNPNRPIEPITKRDWKRKYPEFCISELPGPAVVHKEDLETGYFDYADDNFIVHDCSDSKKMDLYWAWGFVGAHLLLSALLLFNMKIDYDFLIMSFFIACITYPHRLREVCCEKCRKVFRNCKQDGGTDLAASFQPGLWPQIIIVCWREFATRVHVFSYP